MIFRIQIPSTVSCTNLPAMHNSKICPKFEGLQCTSYMKTCLLAYWYSKCRKKLHAVRKRASAMRPWQTTHSHACYPDRDFHALAIFLLRVLAAHGQRFPRPISTGVSRFFGRPARSALLHPHPIISSFRLISADITEFLVRMEDVWVGRNCEKDRYSLLVFTP